MTKVFLTPLVAIALTAFATTVSFGRSKTTIPAEVSSIVLNQKNSSVIDVSEDANDTIPKKKYKKAYTPEAVRTLFLEYVAAGDIEGVLSVFEDDAVVVLGGGKPDLRGKEQLRKFYEPIVASKAKFEGLQNRPEVINGNIALTSTKVPGVMVTVEVSRKQKDGSWLWIIDQPTIAVEQ